jgi:serine/threonine protein kinase
MLKFKPRHVRQRVEVHLNLQPVAAAWVLYDNEALHSLCADVLGTLAALHSEGFVHRDVRDANILRDTCHFLLIDWELAAPIDDPVFWDAADGLLPPDVHKGTRWQPWMDLWQLGQVMRVWSAPANALSNAFMTKLLSKQFSNAAEALESLWV